MASLPRLSPRLILPPPFPLLCPPSKPYLRLFGSSSVPNRRSSPSRWRWSAPGCGIRCSEPSLDRARDDGSSERTSFDQNLAVVLAGFAFEAYTSPPRNVGRREVDGGGCQTVFLSEQFFREIYDGLLLIKLKKALDFPPMDPWGTSDPYVIIQLEGQAVKSTTKWASKEPTWNEDFTLNINRPVGKLLQIAAWDANLVTPHKRMGNAGIDLTSLCDGNLHELVVELEGIGGGGKIHLEVRYKSFHEIDKEKQWWNIPILSDLFMQTNLGSALQFVLGSKTINVSKFVEFAFGQLGSFHFMPLQKDISFECATTEAELPNESASLSATDGQMHLIINDPSSKSRPKVDGSDFFLASKYEDTGETTSEKNAKKQYQEFDGYFWKNLAGSLSQAVTQKLGFSLGITDLARWDVYTLLSKSSVLSQRNAEEDYVQSGLATPDTPAGSDSACDSTEGNYSSPFDIKRASREILGQMETVLGALMVLKMMFSQQKEDASTSMDDKKNNLPGSERTISVLSETKEHSHETSEVNKINVNDTRELFSTAESAMEAWAMLATSLGRSSFIKSEFEKICFLDNDATDTQVAIWRDPIRKRLVVAFRGTEQARWKDLRTDLMLVPSGLNPERLGGDFKEEVQVHSGFLGAYDSVRNRIMAVINFSIGIDGRDNYEGTERWHIYLTGHSLGGALATLLALELSSSRLAKYSGILVTMYNFGSPRVGNKRFAEVYNQRVKDSWRVVNHRDIIPTIPRLMGYCHVAQPIYLAVGDLRDAMVNMDLSEDGYESDIIGEYTPDVLVNEFLKGEKELIEKILEAEINLFRSLRDGSALMQHMEDFYYIALLECVKSTYRQPPSSNIEPKDL